MTNKNMQSVIVRRVEALLNSLPKERLRDIIERRFGLKSGRGETLEAIGHNYGITRERVRQIESDALRVLNKKENLTALKPIFEYLNAFFEEHNHLLGEEKLLSSVTNISESHPSRSALILVLTLGKPYSRYIECDKFYPHWVTKKTTRNSAEKVINYLVNHFKKQNRVYPFSDIVEHLSSKHKDIPKNIIINALDISKEVAQNIFDEIGLSHWADINPKGVKDKAYLMLKKKAEPHHFTKITDLINQANFSFRQAFPQTVHNELIKDERFVLVGRGVYALREWGYEPGVVKDVIIKTLSEANRPLGKDEIVSAVLEQRRVKPNTVVINLQNNSEFAKLEDGRYTLKRQ